MLRNATIPLRRAWYTWSSRPAEMVFLPLGIRLTPLAYAGSIGRATLFEAGDGVELGDHALDAGQVSLGLVHAGTRIRLDYVKRDPFTVLGAWDAETLGEWGLRFWLNLCLSAEDASPIMAHAGGGALVKVGHRWVALATSEPPVQITGHASIEAVAADYERHGYFHVGSRAAAAPVLALRFNFEMARTGRFALAVADDGELAVAEALSALREPAPARPPVAAANRPAAALAAIRDVMAWNTVWDEVNGRAYTSISRNWNKNKFGGFGVWLNDQLYAALLTGLFDADLARDNLNAALAGATPQGNLACLLTANDAWVDRSQLPIGAFLLWLIARRGGGRPLLDHGYAVLSRNHDWWWRNRDPRGFGLCSYGTSAVGEGLYKGTSFGARNESSMDNSPMHDEAPYDPETRTLASFDVGLNALLALDAEMLGRIAAELGQSAAAERHAARAEAVRDKIRTILWDDTRNIFANRLWSGGFVRSLTPTSFYPLLCAAATPAQTAALLRALVDPALFGGAIGLPAVARQDPAYHDNIYWRGRVWPPLNYLVWQGLRRAGAFEQARALAESSFDLFETVWRARRLCPENYSAATGEPLDQPDTDGFYGWGALMPAMTVFERFDVDPWNGWSLLPDGPGLDLGPLESPAGSVRLRQEDGRLILYRGEERLFETNLRGRLAQLSLGPSHMSLMIPLHAVVEPYIDLPGIAAEQVLIANLGGRSLTRHDVAGCARIDLLPSGAEPQGFICVWQPRLPASTVQSVDLRQNG